MQEKRKLGSSTSARPNEACNVYEAPCMEQRVAEDWALWQGHDVAAGAPAGTCLSVFRGKEAVMVMAELTRIDDKHCHLCNSKNSLHALRIRRDLLDRLRGSPVKAACLGEGRHWPPVAVLVKAPWRHEWPAKTQLRRAN